MKLKAVFPCYSAYDDYMKERLTYLFAANRYSLYNTPYDEVQRGVYFTLKPKLLHDPLIRYTVKLTWEKYNDI